MILSFSSLLACAAPVAAILIVTGSDLPDFDVRSGPDAASVTDSIDVQDLEYLFGRMGITRGRYLVTPGAGPFSLDFRIEEYVDGELRDTASTNRMMVSSLPGFEESKAALYIRAMLAHTIIDTVAREGRIYVDQGSPGVAHLSLVLEGKRIGIPLEVDTSRFGGGGSHPFEFDGLRQGERKPLMAVYYVPRGEGFVPCPADAPVPTIVETYPMVWIIYGEAVPLE